MIARRVDPDDALTAGCLSLIRHPDHAADLLPLLRAADTTTEDQ